MSKENTAAKPGEEQAEEFVVIEVDDKGVPLQEADAGGDDGGTDDDDDADGGDEGEERLGHGEDDDDDATRAGETVEERRERRRRDNRTKRIRNRTAAASKDRLIENQGRMLLNLQEQVAKLQGRTVQYDVSLLQTQLSQIEQQQSDAKAVLVKLSKAQDHEGIVEVTEVQLNLRDQHRQISEQLRRAKSQGGKSRAEAGDGDAAGDERQPQRRGPPPPDPEVLRRAQLWTGKHSWAHPTQGDPEEVGIVRAIDHSLHQEGLDPRSDDYWAELTSRVKRRLPHHFKKAAPNGAGNNGSRRVDGDNGDRRPAQGGPRMATVSQSGGGSRPLGRNEVRVTPERKAAMQAAGKWEDPVLRNRQLAAYAKYDKEHAV